MAKRGAAVHQAVQDGGGHGHHEDLVDLLDAAHHHRTNRANELGPAKALLDELALLHRDAVALGGCDLIRHSRLTV